MDLIIHTHLARATPYCHNRFKHPRAFLCFSTQSVEKHVQCTGSTQNKERIHGNIQELHGKTLHICMYM